MTGKQLEAARVVLGISWKELAQRLGVDYSVVHRQRHRKAVSGPIAAAVECWLTHHHDGGLHEGRRLAGH